MREIRQSGSEGGVADNGHPYPYLGGLRSISRVVPQTQPRLSTPEARRFLRKRRVRRHGPPQCRTTRRSVPTSEAFRRHPRILRQTPPRLSTPEVRRFLRKRRVRRHGPPQCRTARRSVPTSEAFGRYPESYHKLNLTRAPPQVGLHPRVSTTNSASPEHLRGKAISPKAPRPQTWTAAEPNRSEIGPYPKKMQPARPIQ